MSIFRRKQPNAVPRRPTAAELALAQFEPPRIATPTLPVPNGTRVPVPREAANRATLQREAKTAAKEAANRIAAAETAVTEAEVALTVVQSRARFGEASAADVQQAQSVVDAKHAQLRECRRNANGGIDAALQERMFIERAALIEANSERQAEELRGLALSYAEEIQLQRDLALVHERRLAFEDSVSNVTCVHASELDTPVRDRAPALIEQVKSIVRRKLGMEEQPTPIQIRHSPELPTALAAEQAMLAEERWLKKRA